MKKKLLLKYLSIVLTFVVALMTIIPVKTTFAAGTGSITVENTGNGATYKAYKIFDATYTDGGVSYTLPDGVTYTDLETYFDTQTNGGKTYVTRKSTATDTDIAAWAKTVAASASVEATGTGNGGTITLSNIAFGYYYVSTTLSDGATVMVTSVNPDATIQEKNNEPSWGQDGNKTVDKASKTYAVGDTVTYTLNYKNATRYTKGAKITQYVVKDTLPAGVQLGDIKEVKVNNAVITNYTTQKDANSFTMTIPWAATADSNNKDFIYDQVISTIEVTYTGTMTKDAAKGSTDSASNKNLATINPNTNTDDKGKEVYVYTGQITIEKENESGTKLKGAEFVLKKGNDFLNIDTATGKVSWVSAQAQASKFTTTEGGTVDIPGLDEGTYSLVETKAPDGYNLLTTPTEVKLAKSTDGSEQLKVTTKVVNKKGAELPSTGGMGTTILYIIGAALVIGGTIVLIARRRARM